MPEKTLHSKYASPTNLSMALSELVGDFTVEVNFNWLSLSVYLLTRLTAQTKCL